MRRAERIFLAKLVAGVLIPPLGVVFIIMALADSKRRERNFCDG